MALRKFQIAIDCDTDEEFNAAQEALRQISGMRLLTAKKVITYYPLLRTKEKEINRLFSLISKGGVKSLMSMEGAQLIRSLTSK